MKKFRYEENGYSIEDVDEFVSTVMPKIDGLIDKNREQREEINSLKEKLKLITYHNEDSDQIIEEAKEYASRIINDALIRASKINKK